MLDLTVEEMASRTITAQTPSAFYEVWLTGWPKGRLVRVLPGLTPLSRKWRRVLRPPIEEPGMWCLPRCMDASDFKRYG